MAVSKEEILNAIASMTVLDLSALIKEMEEKFGVSAAAAAVAAEDAPPSDPAATPLPRTLPPIAASSSLPNRSANYTAVEYLHL